MKDAALSVFFGPGREICPRKAVILRKRDRHSADGAEADRAMSLFQQPRNSETETLPVLCRHAYYELNSGFERHFHDAVEIIAVVTGEMKCTADNRTYMLKSGDIVLFNPYTIHSGYTTAENTMQLCITFALSDVLDYHNSFLETCAELLNNGQYLFDECYFAGMEDNDVLLRHILNLYGNQIKAQSAVTQTTILAELYAILAILFEKHYRVFSAGSPQNRDREFIRNFLAYLQENYSRPITTSDAARALFLSTSRFSYLIKRHLGCNFTRYLCQYRIECAIKKHAGSNCTIKDLSESVGFTDYCSFSRAFKAYTGFSPGVYFKKRKG